MDGIVGNGVIPPFATTAGHPPPRLLPLIPPFRFALVQEDIYRGAYPSLKNLRFLSRLRLRTVISLLPPGAPPSADLVDWCAASGIAHVTYPAAKYDDEVTVSPAVAAAVVSTLIAPGTTPAFLHCRDGGGGGGGCGRSADTDEEAEVGSVGGSSVRSGWAAAS